MPPPALAALRPGPVPGSAVAPVPGSVIADPDGLTGADDNLEGADEEGVSAFPEYNGSTGTYTLNVAVSNQTGATAYASGWMDWNRDGTFTPAEGIVVPVLPGATSAVFSWTGLPYSLADGPSAPCAFRFRIASVRTAVETAGDWRRTEKWKTTSNRSFKPVTSPK